ncbi:MAG: PKD domain-containing protein [Armatimonadetes bacterium]|nr:PKD domain-containing protein [Armatimonadota bacterium]
MKLLAAILGMAFLLPPWVLAAEGPSTVTIAKINSIAKFRKSDSKTWTDAKAGMVLERGDKIKCGPNSTMLLSWTHGTVIKVEPETTLSYDGAALEIEKQLEKSFLTLEEGRLFIKAQVPQDMFCHHEIRVGTTSIITQGAEFMIGYDKVKKKFEVQSLVGRIVTGGCIRECVRVEEGMRGVFKAGATSPENPISPLEATARTALEEESRLLGPSLLRWEDNASVSGPLQVKIGGVRNRRGQAPYEVHFKAVALGGTGKLKSVEWNFGDGKSTNELEPYHEFTQGVYVVTLRVEDQNGQKASAQMNIAAEEVCYCLVTPDANPVIYVVGR